jgi:hypothetical protein
MGTAIAFARFPAQIPVSTEGSWQEVPCYFSDQNGCKQSPPGREGAIIVAISTLIAFGCFNFARLLPDNDKIIC